MREEKAKKQNRIYAYLTNADIEPRKRILNVMLVAVFLSSLLCLVPLLIGGGSNIWLNFLLAMTSVAATVLNIKYKKLDAAGAIIAFASVGFFLPAMYFTQGGYQSGMPLWFVASAIAFFMLTSEKIRYIVLLLAVILDTACMVIEKFFPEWVIPLPTEEAVLLDIVASFLICTAVVAMIVIVFLSTEKSRREKLIRQKEELDEKRIQLEYALKYDPLTKIENRYSYNNRIEELEKEPLSENIIIIAADVDGLKQANDTIGHDAGDELLVAAAEVLSKTFSRYGQVFRIGGDEYQAIIQTDRSIEDLNSELRANISAWRGKKLDKLQLSVGYADNREINAASILELQKMSDRRMYEEKQQHYLSNTTEP